MSDDTAIADRAILHKRMWLDFAICTDTTISVDHRKWMYFRGGVDADALVDYSVRGVSHFFL